MYLPGKGHCAICDWELTIAPDQRMKQVLSGEAPAFEIERVTHDRDGRQRPKTRRGYGGRV